MRSLKDSTELEKLRRDAYDEFSGILSELSGDHPEVVKHSAAMVVETLGDSASLTALYYGGSVAGLLAAGVTSGLDAFGPGGGRVPSGGVLAPLMAVVAVVAYIRERRRNAKLAAALRTAVEKLHRIQKHLVANAEHFAAELAEIMAYIEILERGLRDEK